jgi:hypothetical protein
LNRRKDVLARVGNLILKNADKKEMPEICNLGLVFRLVLFSERLSNKSEILPNRIALLFTTAVRGLLLLGHHMVSDESKSDVFICINRVVIFH